MHESQDEQREEILKLVRDGLYKAESYAKKYKQILGEYPDFLT